MKKYIAELTESGIFSYNINEPLEIRMCVGWCEVNAGKNGKPLAKPAPLNP